MGSPDVSASELEVEGEAIEVAVLVSVEVCVPAADVANGEFCDDVGIGGEIADEGSDKDVDDGGAGGVGALVGEGTEVEESMADDGGDGLA